MRERGEACRVGGRFDTQAGHALVGDAASGVAIAGIRHESTEVVKRVKTRRKETLS